ncbi:MAG TPA: hypothetical protein VF493_21290 [Terriglobales bacterium]
MRLLATLIFASTMLLAQQPTQDHAPTGAQQLKAAAVGEVRALNTAEMRYHSNHGRYAGLEELKSSDEWQKNLEQMKKFTGQDNLDFVAGYDSSVIVDAQGKTYRISVKPKTGMCESSFFSDESGVIFEGIALGCESRTTKGGQ